MIPMEQIFQGIQSALGTEDVKIPTTADIERLRLTDLGSAGPLTVTPRLEELQSAESTASTSSNVEPLRGGQGHPPSNRIIATPQWGFFTNLDDLADSEKESTYPLRPPWKIEMQDDIERFQLQSSRRPALTRYSGHSSISFLESLGFCQMIFLVSIIITSRETTFVNK
jgi:hypothetical protein